METIRCFSRVFSMAAIRSRRQAASSKRSASAAAHPGLELIRASRLLSVEKGDPVPHEVLVGWLSILAHTGAQQRPISYSRQARLRLEFLVPAAPERKDRLEEMEGFPRRAAGGIGAEIAGAVLFRPTHQLEPGERFAGSIRIWK